MALADFLLAGGEAVIRGVLSQGLYQSAAETGRAGPIAEQAVRSALERKGFDLKGITTAQLRGTIVSAARSLSLADQLSRGDDDPMYQSKVPQFPGSDNTTRINYLVKVEVKMPDGSQGEFVTMIDSRLPLSFSQLSSRAASEAAQDRRIESDPKRASELGQEITRVQVVSVYRGMP